MVAGCDTFSKKTVRGSPSHIISVHVKKFLTLSCSMAVITKMENVLKCRLRRCEYGNCRAEGKVSLGHLDCPPAAQGSSKIRYLNRQFSQRRKDNLKPISGLRKSEFGRFRSFAILSRFLPLRNDRLNSNFRECLSHMGLTG
jgi:hypothetical protein